MKKYIVTIFAACIIGFTFTTISFGAGNEEYRCDTKHGVMLVHGFMFRDSTFGIDYFGKIPEALEDERDLSTVVINGEEYDGPGPIARGGQNGWDSMESGAADLFMSINRYFWEHPTVDKLHLICHSQGGFQVRYMLAKYGNWKISRSGDWENGRELKDCISSITLINSPVRGTTLVSFVEDLLLTLAGGEGNREIFRPLIEFIGWLEGDRPNNQHYDAYGPLGMRPEYSDGINNDIRDMLQYDDLTLTANGSTGIDGIYCQSWMSRVRSAFTADPMINTGFMIMNSFYKDIYESRFGDIEDQFFPNINDDRITDGVVPAGSSVYGNFRGIIDVSHWLNRSGIGHQAIVDRALLGLFHCDTPGFDVIEFYLQMVEELKNMEEDGLL